jgi:catechol 2,3-dioxygenase-like lactoylglutathione lyase family enzyme
MIDHTGVLVTDWTKASAFYDAVFAALGGSRMSEIPTEYTGGMHVSGYGRDYPIFWLTEAKEAGPGRHTAFAARSRAEVDAFYAAAVAAGGKDNGGPGVRAEYGPNYYAAFVYDPDGNNIEAVSHAPE